jgi:hypothetical protein
LLEAFLLIVGVVATSGVIKMRIKLIICSIALLTTGCSTFDRQERRINYTETLDANFDSPSGSPSLITDALQRVVINTKARVGVGDFRYDGNGRATVANTDDLVVKNHPSRIICAEPSPDVAQAISTAAKLAGQVNVTGEGSGSGSYDSSYASSIVQLGERLATVQLLRDKMYRACEAFQNGAISDTSYTLMLARFDKTMASMLATETAAGAFGRSLAVLGGNASPAGGDPKKPADPGAAPEKPADSDAAKKKLADAQDALKKKLAAQDAVKNASTILQDVSTLPETDDAAKSKKKTAVAIASSQLTEAVAKLTALDTQSATPAPQSGPPGAGSTGPSTPSTQSGPPGAGATGLGQITGRSAIDANVIERINANFLEDDASGTIIDACVIALDRIRTSPYVADAFKRVNAAQDKVTEAEKAVKRVGGPFSETQSSRDAKQELASAKNDLANAKDNLKNLKPLSFADICATMLRNGDLDNNFLIKLQEEKQKRYDIATNLLIEQAKAAKSEADAVASRVKACADSTKGSKADVQADKYAACISIKLK